MYITFSIFSTIASSTSINQPKKLTVNNLAPVAMKFPAEGRVEVHFVKKQAKQIDTRCENIRFA